MRFIRIGLDEFWFEKRDGTAVCQLTADQTQSLVEYVAELKVSMYR